MKNTHRLILFTAVIIVITLSCSNGAGDIETLADRSLDFAVSQLRSTVQNNTDTTQYPRNAATNGSWNFTDLRGWTSGFFPGCLWYAYEITGEDFFKSGAEKWTEGLEPVKSITGTHDIGFMMFNSFGNGYRLTGKESYHDILLESAASLASRYDPAVGVIRSWDFQEDIWDFPVIVDNMMNLELLFWAVKNGGDPAFAVIAESHARKTMIHHVREDGSTYHVVDYNPETGGINEKYTHQGYSRDSAWARGQAWGIYGFTMSYRETGITEFLETAVRLADYYIENLPEDYVPYWDFDAPGIPDEPRDTSAASITSSALLELSAFMADPAKKAFYYETAVKIIASISSPPYIARDAGSSAILLHAVGSKPAGSEVDVSIIYGDYYFMESLLRLKRGIVKNMQ